MWEHLCSHKKAVYTNDGVPQISSKVNKKKEVYDVSNNGRGKKIKQENQYQRVPVCKEICLNGFTPIEVMQIVRKVSKQCYLLESAKASGERGRFSFW